jgi:hypothetical protein
VQPRAFLRFLSFGAFLNSAASFVGAGVAP